MPENKTVKKVVVDTTFSSSFMVKYIEIEVNCDDNNDNNPNCTSNK